MTGGGRKVTLGLLDGGVDAAAVRLAALQATVCCRIENGVVIIEPDHSAAPAGGSDPARRHGACVAAIVHRHAPALALLSARVFEGARVTSPARVAAGLEWLVERGAAVVNMSFGLRRDRSVLRVACERAVAAGVVLVAAAPARGPAVFPAAYPGVIRVTGDARCAPGEFSRLDSAQADFGACGRAGPDAGAPPGGASFAVPWVSAALAGRLARGDDRQRARAWLAASARYQGAERRPHENLSG